MEKKIITGLGESIDSSLSSLDALLSDGTLEFILGLWDKKAGGFYYSASARAYKGFSPDTDSTLQVMKLLSSGVIRGARGDIGDILPADIKELLMKFADTDKARGKEIKEKLGAATAASSVKNDTSHDRFNNAEELEAYLDELFLNGNAAAKLKGELSGIKKKNLSDTLFDYLDTRLDDNIEHGGIFSEARGRASLDELHKIGALYISENRRIPRASELVKAVMSEILSAGEPQSILDIYNSWAALRTVLQGAFLSSDDEREKSELYSYVRALAKDAVGRSCDLLKNFKRCDGGYSYFKELAPAAPRGSRLALGISEGEMNSTVMVLHGIRGNIFSSLGLTTPPLFDEPMLEYIISEMRKDKSNKKQRIPLKMKIKPYKNRT